MKVGGTSFEVEVKSLFSDDGADGDFLPLTINGREVPKQLCHRLLEWLGAKTQGRLMDECWANADSVDDAHPPEHVSGPVGRVLDGISVDAEGKVA